MKRHRVVCLSWLLAACSLHEPKRPWRGERSVESAPKSFFGIAGLTQTTESGHSQSDWGSTMFSRIRVHRAGRVVCAITEGSSGTGEYGWHRDDGQLSLSSAQPVRFVVRYWSERQNQFPGETRCIGYELPSTADCHQVFNRTCLHEACSLKVSTSAKPGTGTLEGRITRRREPVVKANVLVGSYPTMSDDQGSFAVAAGPGAHEIEVSDAVRDVLRTTVMLGDHEDVEVALDIHCARAPDSACCDF